MPASPAAISVEGLSKRFRLYTERNQSLKASVIRRRRARAEDFWALNDVSFDVRRGETFAVIGENGSGKSTLLKCLVGILTPERGRVTVNGSLSAMLELGSGFHPDLSGRENVYLNAALLGVPKKVIRAKFDDIVEFAGLQRFIDMPVKDYSSGMYVRLGFAVAINVDPEVLVIDEVLAVGDESFQRKCMEKFADLRSQGRTVAIVTHALGTVRTLCDRAVWLNQGRVEQIGDPAEVVDAYVGVAHEDRVTTETEGTRWGSGEGRIVEVELLDARGQSTGRVHTGDSIAFRLGYHAHVRIERPVFGLALYRLDGAHVTGPNTRDAGRVPDFIEGSGVVEVTIPRLTLLEGTYDLSVSLYDYTCTHCFDMRHLTLRFDVERGTPYESGGLVTLDPSWHVDAFEYPGVRRISR